MSKKMLTIGLLVITALGLSGCGSFRRSEANLTGWARVCVAGVDYLQFPHGVTVEYLPNGHIKTCK